MNQMKNVSESVTEFTNQIYDIRARYRDPSIPTLRSEYILHFVTQMNYIISNIALIERTLNSIKSR